MPTLRNKHILICRQPERANALKSLLEKHQANVEIFSPFKIQNLPFQAELMKSLETSLMNIPNLIFGSPNAVNAFFAAIKQLPALEIRPENYRFFTVGQMAALSLQEHLPDIKITDSAKTLNKLLQKLADLPDATYLHITSAQGIQNIHPEIPNSVKRRPLALYETVVNTDISENDIEYLSAIPFDAIVFSSPTSAQYTRTLLEKLPLGKKGIIVTTGPTTMAAAQSIFPGIPTYQYGAQPQQIYNCLKDHLKF